MKTSLRDYFLAHKWECRHFQNNYLDYPHGKPISIRMVDFTEDANTQDTIICLIAFTDGFMGSYSYTADEHFKQWWDGLKKY